MSYRSKKIFEALKVLKGSTIVQESSCSTGVCTNNSNKRNEITSPESDLDKPTQFTSDERIITTSNNKYEQQDNVNEATKTDATLSSTVIKEYGSIISRNPSLKGDLDHGDEAIEPTCDEILTSNKETELIEAADLSEATILYDNDNMKGNLGTKSISLNGPCCSKVLPKQIDRYLIENKTMTKMSLRKVKTSYKECNSPEREPYSSGSSDEYNPSNSNSSSSRSTSPETEPAPEHTTTVSLRPDKSKKRVRKVDKWVKVKAKRLKNSGREYLSKSGRLVRARSMKPPCSEKCVLKCAHKISEDFRKTTFEQFWELGCLEKQREFLGSCTEQLQLKYRRISAGTPRKPNCGFYFHNNGEKIRVCKPFLLNTLGLSERTLRTVISSKLNGPGIIPKDKRGKHNNHVKTSDEILNSIRTHIDCIPRIESHYVRSDTSRQFIDGGLSIAELYRHYSEERRGCNKHPSNYDTYAKIFNTEFNIGFVAPKKDQCDLCESHKNAVGEEKTKLEEIIQKHLEEKELSRKDKAEEKERAKNGEILLAVYDLQAVLPVPMGQTSAFFYKSRLNCYNFTITDLAKDKTKSFFWLEGLGHRGAVEIGTCVLYYLQEISLSAPEINVVFFSDNCGGQQKNRFLIGAYIYAVERMNIKTITHKYLVRGHTQNEGDAIHSIIERALKRTKRSGPIYVPDQYISVIRNAKKKGNPVEVKEMSFRHFCDLKSLYDQMGVNISKDTEGNDFKISDVRVLQFEKGSEVFRFKTSYKQEEWKCVSFRPKKRRSDLRDINTITTKPAYSRSIQLSENKRKDLKSLVDSNIIPEFYRYFYDSVTN